MDEYSTKYTRLLKSSILCSFISSISILSCIFIERNDKANLVIKIVFPLIFWLGLFGEQFLFWKSNSIRKKILKASNQRCLNSKIGLISISQNHYGTAADIVFAVSFIALLLFTIFGIGKQTAQYIIIFLLVLSFRLHCILNGKNFKYINYFKKRKVKNDV